ncbi:MULTISPECIES: GNAT family protein [unclassified Acinetobacter]|uniref:GNAT family N-acetyltransferase n=1 Tax=unclassified Acinetobacter TaxID=196816 RepID=UPI002934379E|nr:MULTISPECIES: GNAT family protein [unclassified Acinetobacter]WOE30354.1 GNAT family protein [Acinetobacter sp. SAAs470]WOE38545.1 GNAT family protein [Acinetobacter sp. SAAs474]
MIRLETSRLILRPFEERDAANLLAYLAHPISHCFVADRIISIEDALVKIRNRQRNNDYIAVCLKDSDQLIGEIFLMKEQPDTYSIGWNFNQRFHGQGYAKESTGMVMNCLFQQFNTRRIYAYVEEDNLASQKLCERLGFRQEGHFLEFISFIKNTDGTAKYENTLQYAILRKEWDAYQLAIVG